MPNNKGQFKKGDPRAAELGSKGGSVGGHRSPSNFKRNNELAVRAGRASGLARKNKQKFAKATKPFIEEDSEDVSSVSN